MARYRRGARALARTKEVPPARGFGSVSVTSFIISFSPLQLLGLTFRAILNHNLSMRVLPQAGLRGKGRECKH